MENTIEFYKSCIKKLLCEYESLKTDNACIELIFDDNRMRYMATWVGWANFSYDLKQLLPELTN